MTSCPWVGAIAPTPIVAPPETSNTDAREGVATIRFGASARKPVTPSLYSSPTLRMTSPAVTGIFSDHGPSAEIAVPWKLVTQSPVSGSRTYHAMTDSSAPSGRSKVPLIVVVATAACGGSGGEASAAGPTTVGPNAAAVTAVIVATTSRRATRRAGREEMPMAQPRTRTDGVVTTTVRPPAGQTWNRKETRWPMSAFSATGT